MNSNLNECAGSEAAWKKARHKSWHTVWFRFPKLDHVNVFYDYTLELHHC